MVSKIFITYKNRNVLLKSNIITPIQTGRDIADEEFLEMLGDNTGDNISILNNNFCELTAIYWVWKNYKEIGNPEKVGFMHYRRHFLFGNKKYSPNFYGLVKFQELNQDYLLNDLTNDTNIENVISKYDAIIPTQIDIKNENCNSNYEHYKKNHHIEDYDKAMEILNKDFQEYKDAADEYNNLTQAYFLNMFVFNKKIFFDYCNFIFGILFKLYDEIKIFNNDKYQDRVLGFISERLTGIFITKLKKEKINYKELPVSFIENTKYDNFINNNDTIQIAVSCSDFYVPYLYTLLLSIMENANKKLNYCINVLEYDISNKNKKILKKCCKNTNIDICFKRLNNEILTQLTYFNANCSDKHYNNLTYARLFIPRILSNYKKCIYCDIDIIVRADLSFLYNIDLDDYYMAVCRDWIFSSSAKCMDCGRLEKYALNVLGLHSVDDYFQNGIQILNLDKMRKNDTESEILTLSKRLKLIFADQCLYNTYYKNRIKYIDLSWNYQTEDHERKSFKLINFLKIEQIKELVKVKTAPKIIHYSGRYKPWFYPDEEFADIWWSYARKTPFYELILKRMMEHVAYGSGSNVDYKISAVKNYRKNILNYWKYKILSNFVFGKTRERYFTKKHLFKDKIRQAKQFRK